MKLTKSVTPDEEMAEETYEKCKSEVTKSVTMDLRKVELSDTGNRCGSKEEGLSKDIIKDSINKDLNTRRGLINTSDQQFARAYRVIEQHFGLTINPLQIDKLENYLQAGLEPELIERAVNETRENGKDIRYLWAILDKRVQQGIYTARAFDEEQARWRARQHEKNRYGVGSGRDSPEGREVKSEFAHLAKPGRS